MNRLDEILAYKRLEVEQRRSELNLTQLRERITPRTGARPFGAALRRKDGVTLIAEIKRASPSAGVIRKDFEPSSLARACERGGARALSILTDEHFFQGKLKYLAQARSATSLPCLRKDFVIDEYQIWEARLTEADAVLLIAAALKRDELILFLQIAAEAELETLVEVHNPRELDMVLQTNAPIIGINNRDLQTLQVDLSVTEKLSSQIPQDRILVSESGIRGPEDIRRLQACGVRAILVGESLMRQADVETAVRRLMGKEI